MKTLYLSCVALVLASFSSSASDDGIAEVVFQGRRNYILNISYPTMFSNFTHIANANETITTVPTYFFRGPGELTLHMVYTIGPQTITNYRTLYLPTNGYQKWAITFPYREASTPPPTPHLEILEKRTESASNYFWRGFTIMFPLLVTGMMIKIVRTMLRPHPEL